MDKDNNNDTSYFNSPDNNNSAGDNHIVYKNKFQPNSRYFTIVIYGLLFVLGAILIFKLIGGFNNTLNIIKYIFNVISPFVIGAFIAFILYPLVRFFYRHLFKEKCHCNRNYYNPYGIYNSSIVYKHYRYRGQASSVVQQYHWPC